MSGLMSVPSAQGGTNFFISMPNIPTPAGSGPGASVSVAVVFPFSPLLGVSGNLPIYSVSVEATQACFVSISNKTPFGFTATLIPPSTGVTLAAGMIDVVCL